MIKGLLSLVISFCAAATLLIAIPGAFLGFLAVSGSLANVSYAENLRFGVRLLAISAIAIGTSMLWFWWFGKHDLPSQFSTRGLMIGVTVVAVVMGLISALLSAR